jgi:hypothetical protein
MADQTRVDGKIETEKWEELKEYIDQNKETDRHSKQFYIEKITSLALKHKREREEQEAEAYSNYKELRQKIKADMDI